MPSETDVINVGLRMIGGTAISNRTDGSTNANIVNDLYDEVRDDLLRGHNWNFATVRAQLAQMTVVPAFEFDHAYALPSDWLKTVSVHDNDAGTGTLFYRMEFNDGQRAILANTEQVFMRYVAQIVDPNLMAADFRMVLSTAIAAITALPIGASNTMAEAFSNKLDAMLGSAKAMDSQGSFPEQRPRGSWANSRGGYYDAGIWPR